METPPPSTPRTEPTEADVEAFKQQLGRPPRGLRAIAHRCPCGQPDVVETAPRLPDGTPFPTTYYLTCPRAASAIGTLEANGVMKEMTERLQTDPEARGGVPGRARGLHRPPGRHRGAGGLPERGRHAGPGEVPARPGGPLARHAAGVNPLGDEAIAMLPEWWRKGACVKPFGPPTGEGWQVDVSEDGTGYFAAKPVEDGDR